MPSIPWLCKSEPDGNPGFAVHGVLLHMATVEFSRDLSITFLIQKPLILPELTCAIHIQTKGLSDACSSGVDLPKQLWIGDLPHPVEKISRIVKDIMNMWFQMFIIYILPNSKPPLNIYIYIFK